MKNIIDLKIDEIKTREDYPPYKCKMCGESLIEDSQQICSICGWQDCDMLYQHPDYFGGPSILSFNQYKNVWDKNKSIIKNKLFGKYALIKQIFEENPNIYGTYSDEQIKIIKQQKIDDRK